MSQSLTTVSLSLLYASMSTHLFFFNDTATTEIYTLSLHDALPISGPRGSNKHRRQQKDKITIQRVQQKIGQTKSWSPSMPYRSEEHTSELQSLTNLVCRLLLEKKKKKKNIDIS